MAKRRRARLRRRAMIAVPIIVAIYLALVFMPLPPVPLEVGEETTSLEGVGEGALIAFVRGRKKYVLG